MSGGFGSEGRLSFYRSGTSGFRAALMLWGALLAPGAARSGSAGLPGTAGTAPPAAAAVVPGGSSLAVNDDVTALFLNPAAIGRSLPDGIYAAWSQSEAGGAADLAALGFTLGGFGMGYQRDRLGAVHALDRVLFASALPMGKHLALGTRETWEHERLRRGDGWLQKGSTWRWDLGLLARPVRYLSLGGMVWDLNQSRLFSDLHRRAYGLGVGLRPLPLDRGSRLTLFADLTGGEKAVWKDEAVLVSGLIVEPLAGIQLSASIEGARRASPVYHLGVGLQARQASALLGLVVSHDPTGSASAGKHASYVRTRSVCAVQSSTSRQRTLLRQPVLATIDLAGTYADESQSSLPLPFPGGQSTNSIRPVLRQLARAEEDPDVKGVLLEVKGVGMGALAEEVRSGIGRIRARGKPVVVHLDSIDGITAYYLAAACDRIVVDPVGDVTRLGFRADRLYYGAMLDSAGIEFEKVHHGKFKSAGEELISSQASEGMKEEVNSILDDIRDRMAGDISRDRHLPRARLEELCDGRILEAPLAQREGLVDSLGDRKDAERILARMALGRESGPLVSVAHWRDREVAWAAGSRVAVLWVDGSIETGKSRRGLMSGNVMGSETVVGQLRAIQQDPGIKAVVLRIDSGGGDGLASDQMWRAVEELQKAGKKVLASMSRVAGSGGYYIACGADEIFADPMTITGSIGVLMLKPNLGGFYRKHRIGVETFERGKMMGLYSGAASLTAEERAHLQEKIDYFYDHFLDRVAAGRPLSKAQIDSLGEGRIWTGQQAVERKLIDRVGGLREAVERARQLAGLPSDAPVEQVYRPSLSFLEKMFWHGEEAALGPVAAAGLAWASGNSFCDLWLLKKALAGTQAPGGGSLWRVEDPALDLLAPGF